MQVLVIAHRSIAHELGYLEPWLATATITRHAREGGPPPANLLKTADLMLVLGSPSSVAEGHLDPANAAEIATVRDWVTQGRPYLGLCFGAQVLACALGGTVTRMPRTYRAYAELGLTEQAPPSLQGPWVIWHEDAITAPAQSTVLARLPHADLAFRAGRAWGLQPHVEVSSAILERMAMALQAKTEETQPLIESLRDSERDSNPPGARLAALLEQFSRTALA
ncbi:MAG: type 1 glutamine amidotransferase [Actinomycetales bacterium]